MFKLAIEVCFENHFSLIHAIFLSLGSTKSGYFFLGHPVDKYFCCQNHPLLLQKFTYVGTDGLKTAQCENGKNFQHSTLNFVRRTKF